MIWVFVAVLATVPVAKQSTMEKVADLMADAGRLLNDGVSGKRVTNKQAEAVSILDQLITSAERQEMAAGKRQRTRTVAGRKGAGQGDPTAPAARSSLPSQAGGSQGSMSPEARVRPGETWGSMPAAERDRILQAIKKNFPARYRDLVEQYFKQMNRQATR